MSSTGGPAAAGASTAAAAPQSSSSGSSSAATTSSSAGAGGVLVSSEDKNLKFQVEHVIGTGAFGTVYKAVEVGSREVVAIKKVLQDRRYKNRELQIMRMVAHPNIVALRHCFYTHDSVRKDNVYLNLVLEYMPESLVRAVHKPKVPLPLVLVKLFAFQLLRALGYLHACNICHRDVKPQNVLIERDAGVLKLCDFGSAKMLVPGEPNVAYISSRYYRAPELIFGSTQYTHGIDLWSAGCVIAEMVLCKPLFAGGTGVDQLVEIIKVLGTPTRDQILTMNPSYKEFRFPSVPQQSWQQVFSKAPSPVVASVIEFVGSILVYDPNNRPTALGALAHPFFDELRAPSTTLPNGRPLPPIFDFTEKELSVMSPELLAAVRPR